MRKIKYYLYPVLLVICLYSCSSTDDDKQEPQPPIEIPDADELASIGVGLVAYYTFDNETGDDSSPNHYDAALINRPDIISDTPSNKGKAVYLKQAEKQYINIPYQLFKNTTYSASMWIKDFGAGILLSAVNMDKALDYPCFPPVHPVENLNFIPITVENRASPIPSPIRSAHYRMENGIWLLSLIFPVVTVQAVRRNYMWTVSLLPTVKESMIFQPQSKCRSVVTVTDIIPVLPLI